MAGFILTHTMMSTKRWTIMLVAMAAVGTFVGTGLMKEERPPVLKNLAAIFVPPGKPSYIDFFNEHYVIVIDPGHGGGWLKDTGSSAKLESETYYERDVVWEYALLIEQKLRDNGYVHVYKTKDKAGDSTLSIFGRMRKIREFGEAADKKVVAISLHWNYFAEQPWVRGTELYIAEKRNTMSRKLAEFIQGPIRHIMEIHGKGFKNKGIVERDYKFLRENELAVLIELGFASNPVDLRKIIYEKDAIAAAIVEGINGFSSYLERRHVNNNKESTEIDSADLERQKEFYRLDKTSNGWSWRRDQITNRTKKILSTYQAVYEAPSDEKTLVLTFDNGYENGLTERILDILKAHDVKSVFFITGAYLKNAKPIVQRMIAEGHVVGNHSMNHLSMPKLDYDQAKEEVLELERALYDSLEYKMSYYRPPSGEYSERSLAIASWLGYRTVFWSFAYDDWDTQNQRGWQYAYKKIMSNVTPGTILLLHATSRDNVEALDRVLKDLKQEGYHFRSLDAVFSESP